MAWAVGAVLGNGQLHPFWKETCLFILHEHSSRHLFFLFGSLSCMCLLWVCICIVIFVSSVDCNRFTMSSECWMSVPLVTRMPSMVVCTLHWTVLPSFRVVLQKPQIKSWTFDPIALVLSCHFSIPMSPEPQWIGVTSYQRTNKWVGYLLLV